MSFDSKCKAPHLRTNKRPRAGTMTWGAARGKVHPKRHVCTRDLRRRCRGESSGNKLAMQVRGGKQRLSHLARRSAIHSRNGNEVALSCLWVFRGPFSLISLSLPGCRASRVDLRGSLEDSLVSAGQTYFYVVTAVDRRRAVTSPPVRPLNGGLKSDVAGRRCSPARTQESAGRPQSGSMTPICFPCRRTESALSFLGSNFITRLLRAVLVGVEGAFLAFALLVRLQRIA